MQIPTCPEVEVLQLKDAAGLVVAELVEAVVAEEQFAVEVLRQPELVPHHWVGQRVLHPGAPERVRVLLEHWQPDLTQPTVCKANIKNRHNMYSCTLYSVTSRIKQYRYPTFC